jgi:hypothetical protein
VRGPSLISDGPVAPAAALIAGLLRFVAERSEFPQVRVTNRSNGGSPEAFYLK